ncbi:MAG: Flp pilus assembly complex ATPase component TadA [Deltaproteobacteria bacterium]|nr:Flp pilus assembly complex ATPase component TadA [Deltaproteobacteria bacterium]
MSTPERLAGARALLRFVARQGRLSMEDAARVEGLVADGTSVHEVLEREGLIGQKDLALLLAETLRLRIVDLTTYPLDANVTRELKEAVATRYEVVPIGIDAQMIEVVTANPLDLDGLKAVEFATGKRVQAVVATQVEVKDALAHTYRLQESLEQFLQLVPASESLVVNELSDEGDDLRTVAADAELPPVIKLADKMLIEGIKSRASDIHVEPEGDSVLVRYRVDGILEEAFRFPKWIQNPLVARLKVMAKLDITERRLPQDGRIQVRYLDKTVDMRVSSLPAQHGEKITLRILDASQAVKALDRLGFAAGDLKLMREAAKKPQGMILITGPTGSGKTTTLYALLREIFSPKTNIVTIENPIEYQLKGINQVEVNEKQGLTFGSVLRSVLRQDPDVILLGEIRDKETAGIAFQAASTGHLVLSTVHTNDAAGAVTRLLDLGLEPYAIASALNLVVAQRLVRQLCPACAKPIDLDPGMRCQLHLEEGATVKQAAGCAQCRHQGYRSRMGVYEMLPMTGAITKLIEAGAGESMVRQQARSEGAHSMLEDAVEKIRAGVTSVEEVQRVVQIADAGNAQCPGCRKEIAEDYSVCPHCSKVLRASCGGCAKPLNPEWVRCPYCGASSEADGAASVEAPAERRSFKALVVDDTATIRDVVRHTLEHSDLGLAVVTAEDGPQALEIAGRERPDIVILDISMPGMDGFEVCRRLRSEMRTAFVPVLMLTAHDSEDDVARGFGVGADDYMVKPFRREGLLARVKRILERTYGGQAVGAPPLPNTTRGAASVSDVEAVASATSHAAEPSSEIAATVAALAAERDALRDAVAASGDRLGALVDRIDELAARVGELAARTEAVEARPVAAPQPDAPGAAPALDEIRGLVAALRESQERRFAELRADGARAAAIAEEALASARATAGAVPPAGFAAMMSTLDQLQGEHAALASVVRAAAAASEAAGGADEECERRLREMGAEVAELRTATVTLEEALQGEALATTERVARELAAMRQDVAAQDERRAEEARRLASVEDAAQRVAGEIDAAIDAATRRLREDLAAIERGVAVRGGVDAALAGRLETLAQHVDAVAAEAVAGRERETDLRRRADDATTSVERLGAAVEALRHDVEEGGRAAVELDARLGQGEQTIGAVRGDLAAALHAAGRDRDEIHRLAAAEAATRATSDEALGTAERGAAELAALRESIEARFGRGEEAAGELREAIGARQGAQERQLVRLMSRVAGARRVAVKVVRRVRAAGRASEARLEAREVACDRRITAVREEALAALADARREQAALAARLDAVDAARAAGEHEVDRRLGAELDALKSVVERLDGDHRRLAADVEERLRNLMRTAANGFDVQLALLRGKVEVLARTLRDQMPTDPAVPAAEDALLHHRHGLMEMLRDQLATLRGGVEWRPQRVLDLLVESSLAAAISPLRRVLQLAQGATSEPKAVADAGAADVTDESTSPS